MTGTRVQRALGGHAAIGLLVSALLYLIELSGALIVVHDRWQRWEQPDIVETATLSPAAVQAASAALLDPKAASVAVVGDAKQFLTPLKAARPATETLTESELKLDSPTLK